ncbi:hypothetical protein DFJ73DRAFT_958039 [Zopfochytrium polystomum]|nr:hypothetical protein DFJ73DRAFT_958039 [Zopfochytrium polystomum]
MQRQLGVDRRRQSSGPAAMLAATLGPGSPLPNHGFHHPLHNLPFSGSAGFALMSAASSGSPVGSPNHSPSSSPFTTININGANDPAAAAAAASASDRITAVLSFEDCFWGDGTDPTAGVKQLYEILTKHFTEIDEILIAIRQRMAIEDQLAQRLLEYARSLMAINLTSGLNSNRSMSIPTLVPVPLAHSSSQSPSLPATVPELPEPVGDEQLAESPSSSPTVATASESADSLLPPPPSVDSSTTGSFRAAMVEKPGGGNTADDLSSLFPVVRNWGKVMSEMSMSHRRHSDTLLLAALTPLQSFVLQHRKVMDKKRAEVDSNLRILQRHQTDVRTKRNVYVAKAKAAQLAQESQGQPGQSPAPATAWGSTETLPVKLKREAEAAKVEYKSAIKAAESARSALEFHITDFLMWAQETEFYRLKVGREAFLALESAQLYTAETQARLWTVDPDPDDPRMAGSATTSSASTASNEYHSLTRLETPSPSRGIENIAVRLRTGSRRPAPFVFESADSTSSDAEVPNQAFGVDLDELARATHDPIPAIVRKCVAALHEHQAKGRLRSGIDAWIRPNPDLPSVHFMRLEFNSSLAGVKVTNARLQRESPAVVAGVLKLFFLETPSALCTHEIYDVLKIVYNASETAGVPEETIVRLKSIASLLTTLSPAHYETLKIFAGLMHDTVRDIDPTDKRLKRLAYSIAPCIIRPKQETSATLADEHPYLLTLDLLLHFPDLFGGPLPLSYFEAPPTPPASPEPEDEYFDRNGNPTTAENSAENGGVPRGFRVGKSVSTLNLRDVQQTVRLGTLDDVGSVTASAWRGIVKSVSSLNMRGGGEASSNGGVAMASRSGSVTGSSWFGWSTGSAASSPQPAASTLSPPPSSEGPLAARPSQESLISSAFSESSSDLEDFEPDSHPCHWAGCDMVLASPEELIVHLSTVHMKKGAGGGGSVRSSIGGLAGRPGLRKGKRMSAAVLPVEQSDDVEHILQQPLVREALAVAVLPEVVVADTGSEPAQ